MQSTNQHIFITGGGSGLGAACARWFASAGAKVTIADLQAEQAQQLAEELGSCALGLPCDVCSAESMTQTLGEAISRQGPLRGLICCAGILAAAKVVGSAGTHDLDLFRRVVEVNLVGSFNTARLAAAAMLNNEPNEQGERGVMIFTSSIAAEEGQIGQAAYAASKGGINALVLPLARELGKHGIRVLAIAPGVFDTPLMQAASATVRNSLEQQIPFPARFGRPEEFAMLAQQIFANPMLNGTTLRLDAGLRMSAK